MAAAQPEKSFEIKHNAIYFCKKDKARIQLGKGFFGEVYKGHYRGDNVAVKIVKPGAMNTQNFLTEAQIMKTMNHPNIIKLLAVCTKEPIYIITELMNGSLLEYIQHKKKMGTTLTINDQIEMAVQVAAGMNYLEENRYIHRDLAARNVLVRKNVYKVADFGLARVLKATPDSPPNEYYEAFGGGLFPVRWMAPEALISKRFTIKNDVWSFGILLYEIMTFGMTPYSDKDNSQVIDYVTNWNLMPCPNGCPRMMYTIMLKCWKKRANGRPSFKSLQTMLSDL